MQDKRMRLSYTSLTKFTKCPLSFRYKYLDGGVEETSPAAMRGKAVHTALENLFNLPPEERTEDKMSTLISEGISQEFGTSSNAQAIGEAIVAFNGYVKRFPPSEVLDVLSCEMRLEVDNEEFHLIGFVDRIDLVGYSESGQRKIKIIDYKTGAAPSPDSIGLRSNELQAEIYATLYSILFPEDIVDSVEFHYLKTKTQTNIWTFPVDPIPGQGIPSVRSWVKSVWAAIQRADEDNSWVAKEGFHCQWCSFKDLCPKKREDGKTLYPPRRDDSVSQTPISLKSGTEQKDEDISDRKRGKRS